MMVDMRLRPWLLASIGLNIMLAAAWYIAELQIVQPVRIPSERLNQALGRTKTNVVVRRINITWEDIASTNLSSYLVNLRAVGCPEPTIRDIILAEVNRLYERRRATEITTTDQEWWKSDPDPAVAATAAAQFHELENDRRAAINALLGTNWGTETDLLAWLESNYGLTGPQLGVLPPETKRAVYDIVTRTGQELKGQTPMNTARIWQNARLELAALLPPEALTEYLLRYSPTAERLREQTRGVNFSPEQFQNLFTAIDPIASLPEFYYQGSETEWRQRQQALQRQYDSLLKQALGDQIYASLQLSRDPLYLSAKEAAQQSGIPAPAIMPLYQINRATQTELDRIRNDTTLTDDDKIDALANARAEAQKAVEQLLGPEVFQRWLQTQNKP